MTKTSQWDGKGARSVLYARATEQRFSRPLVSTAVCALALGCFVAFRGPSGPSSQAVGAGSERIPERAYVRTQERAQVRTQERAHLRVQGGGSNGSVTAPQGIHAAVDRTTVSPASASLPRAVLPAVVAPFGAQARGAALGALLGEGPYAVAFLATFLASENVNALAGGAATRDAIADSYRDLFSAQPAALWNYVRTQTAQGKWAGFERERSLLVASAYEALPVGSPERADALEWLATLVGSDTGPAFVTGAALLVARLGSEEEAEQVGHALVTGREEATERSHVVALLSTRFPQAAKALSNTL